MPTFQEPRAPSPPQLVASVPRPRRLFVTSLVLASLSVAYLIVYDVGLFGAAGAGVRDGRPIARLESPVDIVKRRAADLPVWSRAEGNTELYSKDQVFTGPRSAATLVFDDDKRVELGENALVIVDGDDERPTLNILQGFAQTRLGPDSDLEIRLGDQRARLRTRGAEVQVRVARDGAASLLVLDGSVTLEAGENRVELGTRETTTIEAGAIGRVERIPITLERPVGAAMFTGPERGATLDFAWRGGKAASPFRLEVAQDPEFQRPIASLETSAPEISRVPLRPGHYHWRILGRMPDGRIVTSEARSLTIISDEPPVLVAPLEGEVLHLANDTGSDASGARRVSFDWQPLDGANGYRLDVARDPAFTEKMHSERVAEPPFAGAPLLAGAYYWRVRHDAFGLSPGRWSQVGRFLVAAAPPPEIEKAAAAPPVAFPPPNAAAPRPSPLPAPPALERHYDVIFPKLEPQAKLHWLDRILLIPAAKAATVSDAVSDLIDWPDADGAAGYVVEVARDPAFRRVLAHRLTKESSLRWLARESGRFYLRVATLDTASRQGPWSATATVDASFPAPALWTPRPNAAVEAHGRETRIAFAWEPVLQATAYVLEVARGASISPPTWRIKLDAPLYTDRGLASGSYVWRAGAVFADGAVVRFSRVRSFSIRAKPLAPPLDSPPTPATARPKPHRAITRTAAAPMPEVRVEELRSPTPAPRTLPAPHLVGPADGMRRSLGLARTTRIRFAWSPVDGAVGYELEGVPSAQPRVKQPPATVSVLGAGTYSWRARALAPDGTPGAWSERRSFVIAPTERGPALVLPANATALNDDVLRFQWSAVDGAMGYRFTLARDASMVDVVSQRDVRTTTLQLRDVPAGAYYWRVEATRPKLASLASNTWRLSLAKVRSPSPATSIVASAQAAYAPAYVKESIRGERSALTIPGGPVTKAFALKGDVSFGDRLGIDGRFRRKTIDGEAAALVVDQVGIGGAVHWPLGPKALRLALVTRFGFLQDQRESEPVRDETPNNLVFEASRTYALAGVGLQRRLSGRLSIRGLIDYGFALGADAEHLSGVRLVQVATGLRYLVWKGVYAAPGYEFASQRWSYDDGTAKLAVSEDEHALELAAGVTF